MLTMTDRDEDITACAEAGATEVVRRRADRDELIAAVDRAVHGEGGFTLPTSRVRRFDKTSCHK